VHLVYMQSVTLDTNAWFLHKHEVSVSTHPPRLALDMQVVAHDGKLCALTLEATSPEITAAARARRIAIIYFK